MPKNPRGFPQRLKSLMDGAGWNSRDINRESGGRVSHSAVEAWLKDEARAGDEQVEIVAGLFGWSVPELLYGHPGADTMTRVAELEGALRALNRALGAAIGAVHKVFPEMDQAHVPPLPDPRDKPKGNGGADATGRVAATRKNPR